MKFRYKSYGPGLLRPVIPIEVIFNNKSVYYEVLVDSGADSNIFSSEIADVFRPAQKRNRVKAKDLKDFEVPDSSSTDGVVIIGK